MKIFTIFTDGASRGNPGAGGWGTIVSDGERVVEIGGREDVTTNNRMEMQAVIGALQHIKEQKISSAVIYADSAYVINGATKWIAGWQKNGWQTAIKEEVKNADLWSELAILIKDIDIEWMRISGHSGIPANERVDVIATSFADKKPAKLFSGSFESYSIDLTDVEISKEKKYKKTNSKQKAYSYISLVDGKIETHATWVECEKRVKGKSGARFKKAVSQYEEEEIISDFKK